MSTKLTPPQEAILQCLNYGILVNRDSLPQIAMSDFYGQDLTVEETETALQECLSRGWVRVIDELAIAGIADELRMKGMLGPIYGMPDLGCVDFTPTGAEVWQAHQAEECPDRDPFAYTDVVCEKTANVFPSLPAALRGIEQERERGAAAITGPIAIGPWRAQWWRRFDAGYRVDVEERRQFCGGSCLGHEECSLPAPAVDIHTLQPILDRHNVTLPEWLNLRNIDRRYPSCGEDLCSELSRWAREEWDLDVSEEQCREAREACLRYGWLRSMDERANAETRAWIEQDTAFVPAPGLAVNRRWPESNQWITDFTPAGAQLYRMISAEWLGPDWEDALNVSNQYYWEEHLYCDSIEGFEEVWREHRQRGALFLSSRIVPLGPWCVSWWKRFSSGYRLELELCTHPALIRRP